MTPDRARLAELLQRWLDYERLTVGEYDAKYHGATRMKSEDVLTALLDDTDAALALPDGGGEPT